jgi:hypothetical protein
MYTPKPFHSLHTPRTHSLPLSSLLSYSRTKIIYTSFAIYKIDPSQNEEIVPTYLVNTIKRGTDILWNWQPITTTRPTKISADFHAASLTTSHDKFPFSVLVARGKHDEKLFLILEYI